LGKRNARVNAVSRDESNEAGTGNFVRASTYLFARAYKGLGGTRKLEGHRIFDLQWRLGTFFKLARIYFGIM